MTTKTATPKSTPKADATAPSFYLTGWAQQALKDADITSPKSLVEVRTAIVKTKAVPHGGGKRVPVTVNKAEAKSLMKWAVAERDRRAIEEPTPGLMGLRRGVEAIAKFLDVEVPPVPSRRKAKGPDPETAAAIVEAEAIIDAGESGEKDWGSDEVQNALETVAKARR